MISYTERLKEKQRKLLLDKMRQMKRFDPVRYEKILNKYSTIHISTLKKESFK